MKSHPHYSLVQEVYQRIAAQGFQVYLAGGCVRDGFIGISPNDFDLATNATPDQIIAIFEKTVPVGKAFGTVIVVNGGIEFEVTTFRSDGLYEDGRHPTVVEFSSAEEDAKRRDFTMNALFYDINKDEVVDFVNGLSDIKNKLICAVGNPTRRFMEDHLRILRGVRFVGQLNFQIEEFTRQAMAANIDNIASVSAERTHQELNKMLLSHHVEGALAEFKSLGFDQVLFPGHSLQPQAWLKFWSLKKDLPQKEDQEILVWFLFWNSIWKTTKEESFETQLRRLRFSKNQSQNLTKMLNWRLQPKSFLEKSMGELLELCFDKNNWLAFKIYALSNTIDLTKFNQLEKKFLKFHEQKPAPIVKASDLPEFKKEKLGLALRRTYWAQLEGQISNLQEAKNFLKINFNA